MYGMTEKFQRSSPDLQHQLPIRLILRRELQRTGEDLLGQFDPLRIGGAGLPGAVIDDQPRTEEAVFGDAEDEFVKSVRLRIADGIRWLQRRQVMRLGQQAGDGIMREPGGRVRSPAYRRSLMFRVNAGLQTGLAQQH